jgi:hypothetical protein
MQSREGQPVAKEAEPTRFYLVRAKAYFSFGKQAFFLGGNQEAAFSENNQ